MFFDPSPPSPLPSKGRGGIEGDFRPEAENFKAIGRQPAGKGPWHRPDKALASAGTFGAKHSRWLPPNRYADNAGLCKSATTAEIARHVVLSAGHLNGDCNGDGRR